MLDNTYVELCRSCTLEEQNECNLLNKDQCNLNKKWREYRNRQLVRAYFKHMPEHVIRDTGVN